MLATCMLGTGRGSGNPVFLAPPGPHPQTALLFVHATKLVALGLINSQSSLEIMMLDRLSALKLMTFAAKIENENAHKRLF